MASALAADVLQWDAHDVIVRCPYCQKRHPHGTGLYACNPSRFTGQSRLSHCDDGSSGRDYYRLHYPFEDDNEPTSWVIEKDQGKSNTVGLPWHTTNDDDDWASVSGDECPVACWESGRDSDDQEPDQSLPLSKQFQELSVDPEQPQCSSPSERHLSLDKLWKDLTQDQAYRFFVHVSDCILNERHHILALMSNYSDDFLAATDRTGNNGIALAAAEGHVELLQWLHGQGCDIKRRNCRGRTPLMIASLWGRVPVVDYLLKKGVDAKMRDNKGRSALDLALPNPRNRNERKRKMLYSVPNAGKAIGRLDRGPLFPIISAMSGYSHSEWDPCTILDNAKWTAEVMNLGRRLNVPVEQSYASHVEKQLLAFYVSKHVLLDDELDELQQVKPQGPPVEAKLVVSKAEICHNCREFIARVLGVISMP
ncbi:MAG: hypothetical protein Q9204_006077 [Flavoplaca sp. TL-2023a]